MTQIRSLGLALVLTILVGAARGNAAAGWTNVLASSNSFPIGVWLQSPRNAERFKAAGINLYVGLWQGPSEEQLSTLQRAEMPVICAQNAAGLEHKDNPLIVAWMHDDEPDNAQSRGKGKGYGPPILPERIIAGYKKMRAADPSRPVLLNLGQGVAWDNYIGRGTRRNHPEDYAEYVKGSDIVSFDIYPVVHDNPEVAGKLEYVGQGVERLVKWTGGSKRIWNCIECTHIGGKGTAKATPEQIRSEVWMSLIHGSHGLIYFVHQFEPAFREAALLDDPRTLAAVTAINHRIQGLAGILNSPSRNDLASVESGATPVSIMVKEDSKSLYVFAVCMRHEKADANFSLHTPFSKSDIDVLDEARTLSSSGSGFHDAFPPYGVHIYRIGLRQTSGAASR